MLPFLKPKRQPSLIIEQRKPDGDKAIEPDSDSDSQALEACAEDMIRAMHAKDAKSLAAAFKAAIEVCDSYSDGENDNDYDSMNEKAARDQKE